MDKIVIDNSLNENHYHKTSRSKINFNFMYVIGKGGFVKVWKIQYKKATLKEMSKLKIKEKKKK